jgi:hypothetical protein
MLEPRFRRTLLLLVLFDVSLSHGCKSPLGPFEGSGHRVLYIGNSLTYVNDLPATVAQIAAMGGETISYESIAKADFALIDHLEGGSNAVPEIQRGGWEFVVLQQGSSSLQESRDYLIEWTKTFDKEIRAVGARTALFMVWPPRDRFAFFEDVRLSYKQAADSVKGLFFPTGEAWLTAWQSDAQLPLYGPDDFHPLELGTFLTALVIYERISGRDAQTLPATAIVTARTLTVSEATVRLLQKAAHDTNARYKGN